MTPSSTMPSLVLVDPGMATHRAVSNGSWSDPDVWSTDSVPGDGARVLIPSGIHVTLGSQVPDRIKTIRIDGVLEFAHDVDTELYVDTLVSSEGGYLRIGSVDDPVAADVTARLIFAGDGPIDLLDDPALIGRGALLHGKTDIHGAEKTAFLPLADFPLAGDTSLTLAEAPMGWRPGDTIVIAGVDREDPLSDEVVTITAIEGAEIRFEPALARNHAAPRADLEVHVANLTRNVEVLSENDGPLQRGHVMFMHTHDVNVHHARFSDLGRSDKILGLNDWTLVSEPEGSVGEVEVFDDAGTNLRGRYSIHFHRGGTEGPPAVVTGSVVTDDPGWAFTNHSSNVDFVDNVSYNIGGAAFVTEAGDETGSFIRNIAIRTYNPEFRPLTADGEIDPEQEPDSRVARQDYGWQGDGFWFHGAGVTVEDNIVSGASGHGFIYWTLGLVEAGSGEALVDTRTLPDGDLIGADGTLVRTKQVPVPSFADNQAYVVGKGLQVYYVHTDHRDDQDRELADEDILSEVPQEYEDQLISSFNGFTAWSIEYSGVGAPYSSRLSFSNIDLIGDYQEGSIGVELDHFASQHFLTLADSEIRGFEVGIAAPRQGYGLIENVTLENVTDIRISAPTVDPRDLVIRDVDFAESGLAGPFDPGERVHYLLAPYRDANFENRNTEGVFDEDTRDEFQEGEINDGGYYTPVYAPYLLPDRIVIENQGIPAQGLYFLEQDGDAVPIESGSELDTLLPDGIGDRTNAELMMLYGLAWGGALMPPDARETEYVSGGRIGTPPPAYDAFPPERNDATLLYDEYGRTPTGRVLTVVVDDVQEPDDVEIVQRGVVTEGAGFDVYVISGLLVDAGAEITISDSGMNKVQLIEGLVLVGSRVASTALMLTLANGATVTILDAPGYVFEAAGNPLTGEPGVERAFGDFVDQVLGTSVPGPGKVSQGGAVVIGAAGSAGDAIEPLTAGQVQPASGTAPAAPPSCPVADECTRDAGSAALTNHWHEDPGAVAPDHDADVLDGWRGEALLGIEEGYF